MRNETHVEKFDKLSNLSTELQQVEKTYIHDESAELAKTRNSVVGGLQAFGNSRFQLGRVLRQYKMHFKSGRGWVAAAKLIAAAMDREERTVFRIIEDHERASKLPSDVLMNHGNKRVVYGVALARNFREVLLGSTDSAQYNVPRTRGKQRTEMLADFWRQRWLLNRLEKPGVLDEVTKHTTIYPIRHGAQVTLPQEQQPESQRNR